MIIVGILFYILNIVFGTILLQESLGRALNAFIAFYLVGISSTVMFNNKMKSILENRVIMYLGKISFGMYVYHLLIWGSFGQYSTRLLEFLNIISSPKTVFAKMFLEFIFILICTIIVSIISFELFEKRILVLKKYFPYSKA